MAALSDPQDLAALNKRGVAAGYYNSNISEREPYLKRARDVSELTIPSLFRQEGANGSDDTIIPWNSIGAYCVNNLASKVVFALFPAGRPNFKAEQDKRTLQDLSQLPPDQQEKINEVIQAGLSKLEQDVASAIEEDGDRARMFVAALRLLIGGNHAFQFYDDSTIRGIPLERFVLTRDPQGNLLEFALKDCLDWDTLSEDLMAALAEEGIREPVRPENGRRPVDVYTHGRLATVAPFKDKVWVVQEEVLGVPVPNSQATYTKDALPFLFLPWILLDGESYGRSYVEFYEGDLLTAESLTKTIGEGSAALARLIMMVDPTGLTEKRTIAKAKTGDVVSGREQDVTVLTAQGKSVDFQIADGQADKAIQRLSRAFLLNSSIQRGGERVTAEEIRYVAQELEDALGGVYSQQIITWQAPYIRLKLHYLQKQRRVTPLPKGAVKITVTAGLAALARNAELSSLRQGADLLQQMFGPQAFSQFVKPAAFAARVWAALGVDPTGLTPTEDELAQQQQQNQGMAVMQSLGPEALRQLGNNVTSNQVAQTNADAKTAAAGGQAAPAPTDTTQE